MPRLWARTLLPGALREKSSSLAHHRSVLTALLCTGVLCPAPYPSGIGVFINSSGQLGTATSSRRFKENIGSIADSRKLFELRPVTFFYKPEYDDGSRQRQYGLIAEEVALVYPDLVVYDKDGKPYTVKYQFLTPLLLDAVQKDHRVIAEQQKVISVQQEQINDLKRQMAELKSLIQQIAKAK